MNSRKVICGSALLGLIDLLFLVLVTTIADAATFTVNSTADVAGLVANCQSAVRECTLRSAIQAANVAAGDSTIVLPAGTYILTLAGANEDAAATGDLDIISTAPNTLTISGAGAATTTIDGNATDRIFDIIGNAALGGAAVTITDMTLRNGNPGALAAGGAINTNSSGALTLNNVIMSGNRAGSPGGGAVNIGPNGATVNMSNAAVTSNASFGGNIIAVGATSTLTVTGATFSGNTATPLSNTGTTTLTNVTISGNTGANAGAIDSVTDGNGSGVVTLQNCTINGNTATVAPAAAVSVAGGIRNTFVPKGVLVKKPGTVNLRNTIISNNTSPNCDGVLLSQGNNLSSDATCVANFPTGGDINNTSPVLGPLADNGGVLLTHALLPGSPAIDTGSAAGCPATDERDVPRPVDGNTPSDGVATCDRGAYEFRPQKLTVTLPPPFDFGPVTDGATADHTITLGNAGDGPLTFSTIAAADPLAPPFGILTDNCSGLTLGLGTTCTVVVRFAPTAAAVSTDTFSLSTNDPGTPTAVFAVSGTGVAGPVPGILVTDSVDPNNDNLIPFGGLVVGNSADATVTVTNTGTAALNVGHVASANPLAAPFSILNDACSNQTVAPGGKCTLTVRFSATSSATVSDTFDIPSAGLPTVTVSVTGTATDRPPVPGVGNNPPSNPVLVSPTNNQTGVGATMTFVWKGSVDQDGDAVTYHFTYGTDPNLVGAQTIDVASAKASGGLMFAGLGSMGGGIILFGFVSGSGMKRSRKLMLFLPVLLLVSALFTSCGGGGGGGSSTGTSPGNGTPASDQISTKVTGLASGTTYFWKVVADDGKGGLASSEIFTFKTQ